MDDPPELVVPDAAAWHDWLCENHTETAGVWLVLARKGTTEPTSLSYDQALDEALPPDLRMQGSNPHHRLKPPFAAPLLAGEVALRGSEPVGGGDRDGRE